GGRAVDRSRPPVHGAVARAGSRPAADRDVRLVASLRWWKRGESNPGRRGTEVNHGQRKRDLISFAIPGAPATSRHLGTGCPKLARYRTSISAGAWISSTM